MTRGYKCLASAAGRHGLWVLMGVPGAGKTTLARAAPGMTVVSIDEIRRRHGWTREHPQWLGTSYRLLHQTVNRALRSGQGVIADTSGLYRRARRQLLTEGREAGVLVRCIILDTPVAIADARNAGRYSSMDPFGARLKRLYPQERRQVMREEFDAIHVLSLPVQLRLLEVWERSQESLAGSVGGRSKKRPARIGDGHGSK